MVSFTTRVNEATNSDKPDILGVIALAVDHSGTSILAHSAGRTSLDANTARPITQDSILTLASCTKLITTIAAICLVQQGKLDLDNAQVVETHLPELCQQDVFTSAPGEPLTFETRKNGITVRQLLTHTSGAAYDILNPLLQAWRKSRGEQPISLGGALPDALAMPSLFQPGEGWTYGGGHDWTGLLMSRLMGTSLDVLFRKEIFDIVGCDARIGFDRLEVEKHGEIVQVATKDQDGNVKPFSPEVPKGERGGGGLYSSAANFIKILADLIAPEPRILNKQSLDLLFAPQLSNPKALAHLHAASHIVTAMTGPLTAGLPPTAVNHALGGLLTTADGEELKQSSGTMTWGGAFSCMWFANREKGVVGFYGSSMFPPAQGRSSEMMGEFMKAVWAGGE